MQPCLIDADFPWVEAVNETDFPVTIERRPRIGALYETNFPTACYVSSEAHPRNPQALSDGEDGFSFAELARQHYSEILELHVRRSEGGSFGQWHYRVW